MTVFWSFSVNRTSNEFPSRDPRKMYSSKHTHIWNWMHYFNSHTFSDIIRVNWIEKIPRIGINWVHKKSVKKLMIELTQQVNTLDAALLKWKLRTHRNESAHSVNTYSSPPRSESTSLSAPMKAIWAQSKLIFTPSCGSVNEIYHVNSKLRNLTSPSNLLSGKLVLWSAILFKLTPYGGTLWFR